MSSKPARERSAVDLPQPEPPSSTTISPGLISRLKLSSALLVLWVDFVYIKHLHAAAAFRGVVEDFACGSGYGFGARIGVYEASEVRAMVAF